MCDRRELRLEMSFGNRKLPRTTAIFNMTPAFFCPSDALGMCGISKKCYAKKAERMYEGVRAFRRRQTIYWAVCSAEQFVEDFDKAIYASPYPVKALRFNESGDFREQADVEKASDIAQALRKRGIVTYLYTMRNDLDFRHRGDLIVNGSGFMVDNNFTVFPKDNPPAPGEIVCPGDCRDCKLCLVASQNTIHVRMH